MESENSTDREFNIVEVEKSSNTKSKLLLEEKQVKVILDANKEIKVFADDFLYRTSNHKLFNKCNKTCKRNGWRKIYKIENKNLTRIKCNTHKSV